MAKLTTNAKKKLPKKSFAIKAKTPAKGKPKGSYPIPDVAHARNALARVAQFGSPAQKAQVKAAVRKHFPDIVVSGKKKK